MFLRDEKKKITRVCVCEQEEFEMVMRLMGVTSIDQIKPEMVDIRNLNDHFASSAEDHLASSSYERMKPRAHFSKL